MSVVPPTALQAAALAVAGCATAVWPSVRLRPIRGSRTAAVRPAMRRALTAGLGVGAAALLLGLPVALTVIAVPAAAAVAARVGGRRRQPGPGEMRDVAGFLEVWAACLDAGSATDAALAGCLDAGLVRGDPADVLAQARSLLALGSDPVTAWHPVAGYPPLAALAGAASRSAIGGVRLADAAREAAADLRARVRDLAERRAARAGVAMAAPLAVCFLPAFICLGLAPTIIGLVSSLHLW